MRALFFAALAALSFAAPARGDGGAPAPAANTIAGGDLGTLEMPALALPAERHLALGLSLDYFRGSDFLLPGATVQKGALSLGAAYAALRWLEVYGALGFSDANRFGPSSRQTLTSAGDGDLGVKAVLPVFGPLSAGALLELDLPAGVGGVSFKGTGGRAGAMASFAQRAGPVPLVGSALLGYVLDDTYKLLEPIGTFPAYALDLSLYDRVQGELSVQSPLRWAAPVAELVIEAPVARGQTLPESHPARARLLLGATAIETGVAGLTASAGLALSLVRTGRIYADALPLAGFAPDSPWRALVSISYSFEPKLPEHKEPVWHDQPEVLAPPRPPPPARAPLLGQAVGTGVAATASQAAAAAPPIRAGRGRIAVQVLDAHTQLPLANAWVSAIELSDLGATTGPDGRATLDAPPGQLTIAVAHDGFDPYSDSLLVLEGRESELAISLQPQLTDATVRGRILGDDAKPLRASIEAQSLAVGAVPLPNSAPEIFEGAYSLALPHGAFKLLARAPGYRSEPIRIDLLPGEVATRDVELRRVEGEPVVRVTPTRVEVSERLEFTPDTPLLAPASSDTLAELARTLVNLGPVTIGVRVDSAELSVGEDELTALLLAEQRASAVADALVARGVPRAQLEAHGMGIAKEGQPLLEIKRGPAPGKSP